MLTIYGDEISVPSSQEMQWGGTRMRDANWLSKRIGWLSKRIRNSQNHQEKIWNQGLNDLTIVARTSGHSVVAQSKSCSIFLKTS